MKKVLMAALAVATLAFVGCDQTEKTDYLKNLNGYWLYEDATATPAKVALEVADNAVVLTVDATTANGTLSYDASTGKGTIECADLTNTTVEVAAIDGDKKNINLTIKGAVAFEGKLTKTVKPDDQQGGTPDLDKPAAGIVRFAIHIPAGSECKGIAFKGTFDGDAWSGENTYCDGEQNAKAGPDECLKFKALEGYDNWYTADYKLGATAWDGTDADGNVVQNYMAGKICLIYTGDINWQGQAIDWDYDMKYTSAAVSKSGDGNIQVNGEGLVYVEIGGWQKSECVTVELTKYTVNLKAPDCGGFAPAIIGGFEASDWKTPFAMTKQEDGSYQIVVEAAENDNYKFVAVPAEGAGVWDNEIQILVTKEDGTEEWQGNPNLMFGTETTINIDYSAGKYKLCE